MHKFLIAAAFSTVAGAAGYAGSGSFSNLPPSLTGINASAPRYTTQDERLVSEIAGSILNIAAFADHFETGDAFQVRNVGATPGSAKFSLARRAEVFTVEVRGRVWTPGSYVPLARSFMADGAGLSISEDATQDRTDISAVLDAGAGAIQAQNERLSRLLGDHPRSAALHERAALLLAAAARLDPAGERPSLLNRMTAHLAVARALHAGVLSHDGQIAEQLLLAMAANEPASASSAAPASLPDPRWTDGPATFGDRPRLSILPPL